MSKPGKTSPAQCRRRQCLINPQFQWGYLRQILLLEALVFVVAVLMTLAAHHLLFIRAMESGQGYWSKMFGSASVIFALVALGLVWVGLRLSNRISGPLYRVTQVLAEVTQGKLPRMCKIRTGDKHPEVADALTDALTTLRKARSEESAAWREQGERLATLAKEVSGAPAETLSQLAAKAQERSKKLALD